MLTRFFHAHSTPEQAGEGAHLYEISMFSTDLTVWQQLKKK